MSKRLSRIASFRGRTCVAALSLLGFVGCSPFAQNDLLDLCCRDGPRFSADSAMVAFASPVTGRGDIYEFRPADSKCVRLTSDDATEIAPLYAPDGSFIAYLRQTGENGHVWIMNADGTHQRQVTQGDVEDREINGFSEDSTKLFFERSKRLGPNTIDDFPMRIDVDGSNLVELERVNPLDEASVTSPDGRFVAGSRVDYINNKGDQMWVTSREDGRRTVSVEGSGPVFSPDSKRVFYWLGHYASSRLAVINVDGTGQQALDLPEGFHGGFEFSHNGEYLAILLFKPGFSTQQARFALYLVDLRDDSVREVGCGKVGRGTP